MSSNFVSVPRLPKYKLDIPDQMVDRFLQLSLNSSNVNLSKQEIQSKPHHRHQPSKTYYISGQQQQTEEQIRNINSFKPSRKMSHTSIEAEYYSMGQIPINEKKNAKLNSYNQFLKNAQLNSSYSSTVGNQSQKQFDSDFYLSPTQDIAVTVQPNFTRVFSQNLFDSFEGIPKATKKTGKLQKFVKHPVPKKIKQSKVAKFNTLASSIKLQIDRKDENSEQDVSETLRRTQSSKVFKPYLFNSKKFIDSEPFKIKHLQELLQTCEQSIRKSPKHRRIIVKELDIKDFDLGLSNNQDAFGATYPAQHKQSGFICNIRKISKIEMKKVPKKIEQFIQGLKIQSKINNSYVIQFYGLIEDQQNVYVMKEYVQTNMFTYLKSKSNKTLEEKQAKDKLRQIAKAIKELHSNDIIHRSLKPQNIAIIHNTCKIQNLELASQCSNRRNSFCGSRGFISPEVIQGVKYDQAIDLWCFGVIAYQMLTGQLPFAYSYRKQNIKKQLAKKIKFPESLSIQANNFINSVLKQDPKERATIQQCLKNPFLNVGF